MKKTLLVICILLAILSAWLAQCLFDSMEDRKRLHNNQEALMSEVRLYETKAGESAASVQRLQLTYAELEKNYQAVCQEAKDLGIKVKRLQSVAQTASQTNLNIQADVKDSIVYRPEIHLVDTLKHFSWKDPPWAFVSGVIDSGKVSVGITTTDTITQIVHKVPKKFLFFRFGCKAIKQEVKNKNPHSKIYYTEYIELKK